jgi:hypothetical protein
MADAAPGSMPETLIDSMLQRLGDAPGDDRVRALLEAEREATRTGRPAFEPGPLCRDHYPCRGPETWHWNNLGDGQGGDLFAWDCLEPAGHGGWCRSEIVTDDISTHRLYWEPPSAGDEYELVVIRSIQPAPHQDGRPFDPDQMRLFDIAEVPRHREPDLIFVFDLSGEEITCTATSFAAPAHRLGSPEVRTGQMGPLPLPPTSAV